MPHIHEKYDFVIAAFLVYKNKVLLANHPRYNMWIPIGGHVELEEDTDEALFREILEESGLKVEIMSGKLPIHSPESKPLYSPNFVEAHDANAPHRHIALVYFAKAKTEKFKKSDEHSDMRWFSDPDLDLKAYNLTPAIKYYARSAISLANKWPIKS